MPLSQINTNSIVANAITAAQIANNAITAAQVANNTIGTQQLNNLTSANVSQINTSAGTPSFTTGANTINFGAQSIGASSASTMKNRIINGAMVIDQRNAGASVSAVGYCVDRWNYQAVPSTKGNVGQNLNSITPPAGFTNYLGFQTTSAYSVTSSDNFDFQQPIEGYNIADLGWGTANAKTVTLSFWVQSSLTGTFGGSLFNSATTYSYPFSYTISSANTWTQVSITIPGANASQGSWATNNSAGIFLCIGLGVGSGLSTTANAWTSGFYRSVTGAVSVVGTLNATFYITGVQLEVGSSATSFDYRQYGTELQLCQRYAYVVTSRAMGEMQSAGYFYFNALPFPVTMRTTPTMSNATYTVSSGAAGTPALLAVTGSSSNQDAAALYNPASNWTATAACAISATFSAEL